MKFPKPIKSPIKKSVLKGNLTWLAKWKRLSILTIIVSLSMAATKCADPNVPEFKWSPDIYLGDSEFEGVVRKHNGEVYPLKCADPRFDDMVCMHKSEIRKAKRAAYDVINQCDRWKSPEAQSEASAIFERLETQLE